MGIFSFRKKKKIDEDSNFEQMTIKEAMDKYKIQDLSAAAPPPKDIMKQAEEHCKQIIEVEKKLDEAKKEYEAVTAYLSDMQKIDLITLEDREDIDDAARKIINLSKERIKYQKNNSQITDAQYHYLERFERDLPKEIERISQEEKYQLLVKNDLKQLEGEKGVLAYEKESAMEKQVFIKKLSIVTFVLTFSVFILLFMMNNFLEKDFTIPFISTGFMAIAMVLYIVLASRNSIYRMKVAQKKLNRVVELTNKVKIKYVNTTNSLEYSYEKYRVNSCQELAYLWGEFMKAKDESEQYKKNTELLESYNDVLIEELKKHAVADAEVWTFQPEALLDKKEMVEVRHRLNNRRQKLRELIEYNNRQRDISKNGLLSLKRNHIEYNTSIDEMMNGYHIIC